MKETERDGGSQWQTVLVSVNGLWSLSCLGNLLSRMSKSKVTPFCIMNNRRDLIQETPLGLFYSSIYKRLHSRPVLMNYTWLVDVSKAGWIHRLRRIRVIDSLEYGKAAFCSVFWHQIQTFVSETFWKRTVWRIAFRFWGHTGVSSNDNWHYQLILAKHRSNSIG